MLPRLSPLEEDYLSGFPQISVDDVGALVGMGAEHVVRDYGIDQVIKYPRLHTMRDIVSLLVGFIMTPTADRLQWDYDLAVRYFGDAAILPTEIIQGIKAGCYCILQPKMQQFEPLTPRIVSEHPEVQSELRRLVRTNKTLFLREGKFLDMQGWNAANLVLRQPYLDNVVKVPDGATHLRIPDVTLYPAPDYVPTSWFARIILECQRRNLQKFGMKFPR